MAYQRPRRRTTTTDDHEWTAFQVSPPSKFHAETASFLKITTKKEIFQKHTLLCLMAKGMHLEERGKRSDEPGAMRRHAYLNVATELNLAVNGKNGYGEDIDKREVAKMIDRMLVEKKGVVGKGGYMERATRGRITRGLKMAWERSKGADFDGSLGEWNQWRKESEEEKRLSIGGSSEDDGVLALPETDGKFNRG